MGSRLAQIRTAARPQSLFYGWKIVFSAFVGQVFHGGFAMQGFGAFITPLEQTFGWSKGAISGARAVMQIEASLTGPIEGWLIDRFGPRIMMTIGMVILGLGMVMVSLVQSLWMFYLAFVVVALGTSIGGFLVMSTAINNWFRRKRTLALSIGQMGMGLGGIALIPLLVFVMEVWGWRAAALSAGISIWIVGIPAARLMRDAPERYGLLPDGDSPADGPQAEAGAHGRPIMGGLDFTLGEAIRSPAFWTVGLAHGLSVMAITAAITHQFAHMEQGILLSRASAASVVVVLSATNMAGRLAGGILGDRYDKRHMSALGAIGSSASLAVLGIAGGLGMAMAYGAMMGFFWGMRGPMMASIRGDYFGRTAYGKIAGTSFLVTIPGSMLGPVLAGWMADVQGSYDSSFLLLAGISSIGALLFLLTRPPAPPKRLRPRPT